MSIIEVAKRAGVSTATISRVINHHSGVSPETVANVRRAMEELGYQPPVNRRGPKLGPRNSTKVTNILFLVFADSMSSTTTGFQQLVSGVSSQLEDKKANLAIKFVSSGDEFRSLNLTNPRVDGVLAHGKVPTAEVTEALSQLPTVWLMSNAVRPTWGDQVTPGNEEIGRVAAQYLVDSGSKNLAYLNLLPGHWALHLHARAFINTAEELNVPANLIESPEPISDRYFINFDPKSSGKIAEAADRLIDELLKQKPRIDGAFIAEDSQAAVLVPALQRRGIDCSPNGDLALISCNNELPYLIGLNPCPPTIDIRIETIGSRGAAQLLWRIADGSQDDRMSTTVQPRLVLPGQP